MSIVPITAAATRREKPSLETRDITLPNFMLEARRGRNTQIAPYVTAGEVIQTIDGASTLTMSIHDPHWNLLTSGVFDRAIDVEVDGYQFRLDSVGPQDDELQLVFIDRDVARIRAKKKIKSASRKKMTRAEFILSLIRAVPGGKIDVVIKELHKKQTQKKPEDTTTKERRRDQGLNGKIYMWYPGTVKLPPKRSFGGEVVRPGQEVNNASPRRRDAEPKRATREQIRNMERVLDAGVSIGAPDKVLIAAILTVMVETSARNLAGGDADSRGIFQQQKFINGKRTDWPAARNVEKDAIGVGRVVGKPEDSPEGWRYPGFFPRAISLSQQSPDLKPWEISVQVQRPHSSTYYKNQQAQSFGQAVVDAYSGEQVTEVTRRGQFRFSTADEDGKAKNWWRAIGDLVEEVGWSRYMANGVLYIASEEDLFKQKPRLVISGKNKPESIHRINFQHTVGRRNSEAMIICRGPRWYAPPGTLVKLEDCGPGDGKWLVSTVRRSLFSRDTEISLKKPRPELKEPAPDLVTVPIDEYAGSVVDGRLGLSNPDVIRVYQAAKRMSDKQYPYVWGGGHARCGVPDRGTDGAGPIGYDCSGSVAAVLSAAKDKDAFKYSKGESVPRSDHVGARFVSGKGKELTIWANAGHIFMEFHRKGHGTEHFGTGRWGKSWSGAGFNPDIHPKTNFTATHPAGA